MDFLLSSVVNRPQLSLLFFPNTKRHIRNKYHPRHLLRSDLHVFNFRFNCESSALLCQAMECTCLSLEVNLTYCCIYSVHFYKASTHSSTVCQESSCLAINYLTDGTITASQSNVFLVPLICILKQLHYYNVF